MKIAMDIDGVLAEWNGAFAKVLTKLTEFETVYSPSIQPATWEWMSDNYTDDEIEEAWEIVHDDPHFWESLQPMPLAIDAIQRLNLAAEKLDHEVYYITMRAGKDVKRQTERWLTQLGAVNPTVLIAQDKKPLIYGLACEVAIDDRPENLVGLPTWCRTYLVDRPYNARAEIPGAKRVPHAYEALQAEGVVYVLSTMYPRH